MSSLRITRIRKSDPILQKMMSVHYSQPKGFVGRQLFYHIEYEGHVYGCIAFGSTTKNLPGREITHPLTEGMNNIFYHVAPIHGKYPLRNFTTQALLAAEQVAITDYKNHYGDRVRWIETLVEYPRTGELYKRAGYKYVGDTKGYTCKRVGGKSTDSWSGRRVWDYTNLRPKRVFIKELPECRTG